MWLPLHEQIHLAEFPDQWGSQASDPGLFLPGSSGVSAPFSPDCQPSYPGSVLPLLSSSHALDQECMEPFDGDLELAETMFGGRRKGKRGWGASGKVIVFGILKRNGQVRVSPIPRRNREEVMRLVRTHTKPGSLYFTELACLCLVGSARQPRGGSQEWWRSHGAESYQWHRGILELCQGLVVSVAGSP